MSLTRAIAASLVLLAACSNSRAESVAKAEEPWSHAYSGASDGWWRDWNWALDGKAPFGPGTRFEMETLGPHGMRQTEVIEVVSIRPNQVGSFEMVLRSSTSGMSYRASLPPDLAYTPGNPGFIVARNEKLVPVTVPAGTFSAGRLWTSERVGSIPYERDEWVVPNIPVRIQTWSRPVSATEHYNPPADGTVPEGTTLTRLVRIDRK